MVEELFPLVVKQLRSQGKIGIREIKTLLVMFADIAGFSKMTEEQRTHKLDLMRLIGRAVLTAEHGLYLNTWGDGVIAAFDDPTQGLRCACRFVSHLGIDGIDVRVGVNWGAVRVIYNEVTRRTDVDGESVNFGARLEPLAEPGEVLASELLAALPELNKNDFVLAKKEVTLSKAVSELVAGDKLLVYSVRLLPNK